MLVFLLNIISSVIERAGRGKNWTSFVIFAFIVLLHPIEEKGGNKLHIHYFLYAWANQIKDSQDRCMVFISFSNGLLHVALYFPFLLLHSGDQCIAILEHRSYSFPSPLGNNGAMSS